MGKAPRFLAIAAFFLWSTRGLTGLPYVLLGSVAEHVLREADCDVLAVRPDAFHRGFVHQRCSWNRIRFILCMVSALTAARNGRH